ncbi:MAG: DUF5591 domain-containing protein [Sulfolobaceae archaeon]
MSVCQELERELGIKEKVKLVKSRDIDLFQHPIVRSWHNYILYKWFSNKPYALLLPCTSIKPYSLSRTHKAAYSILKKSGRESEVQVYSISEPMLLVPREFEECYPFNNYDYPPHLMSDEEKEEFISLLIEPLKRISGMHKKVLGVLPKHHYEIVKKASEIAKLNIELIAYGRLPFKSISLGIRKLIFE